MGQFVGQQVLAIVSRRSILPGAKDQVTADCVRFRRHRVGANRSFLIRMNADLAEIMAEARLKECARGRVERLAWRMQNFVHDWGNDAWTVSFAVGVLG